MLSTRLRPPRFITKKAFIEQKNTKILATETQAKKKPSRKPGQKRSLYKCTSKHFGNLKPFSIKKAL